MSPEGGLWGNMTSIDDAAIDLALEDAEGDDPGSGIDPRRIPSRPLKPRPTPTPATGGAVWPSAIEMHIKVIGSKCAAFKWLHQTAHQRTRMYDVSMGIIHLVLVLATGLVNVTTAAMPNGASPQNLDVSSAVMLFVSFVVAALQHFLRLSAGSESHRVAALRYSTLYHNVLRNTTLKVILQREKAEEYFGWLTAEYDVVYGQSPRIPDWTMKAFHRQFHHPPPSRGDGPGSPPDEGIEVDNPALSAFVQPERRMDAGEPLFRYELDRFMLNEYQSR